jgi:hypothetical protein
VDTKLNENIIQDLPPDRTIKGKNVKCTLVQALRLCTGRTAHRGSRGIALPFLDHGTRRGWGVSVTTRPLFTPGRPGTHCTGGWVGPRAGLDRCGKSRPPPGFDPRTIQPVASRCTDYATRPTTESQVLLKSTNSWGTHSLYSHFSHNWITSLTEIYK